MLVVLGTANGALAQDAGRDACIQAYVDAQSARKDGALRRAEQRLEQCAVAECPGMIQRDCSQWLDEVKRALPSIVITARDDRGRDLLDATVTVDGEPVPLDGKPLALDPGRHTVSASARGGAPQQQVLVLAEGEHERPVTITFPLGTAGDASTPAPSATFSAPPATEHATSVPVGAWILGGVSLVSLGVFTYFGVRGANDRVSLGCDRGCSDASYGHVNDELTAADVSLGVGAAALGVALLWWWLSRDSTPSAAGPAVGVRGVAGVFR
jgi:hypothetical protein